MTSMPEATPKGLAARCRRIINAFHYSMKGLNTVVRHEAAVQDELLVLVPVVVLALLLGDTGVEKALLIGSWVLVIIVELLNTAVESLTDRVGTEWHPLSGQAKDIGSGAVFVAMCLAAIVWLCVLLG